MTHWLSPDQKGGFIYDILWTISGVQTVLPFPPYPIILHVEWTTFIWPSLQPCPGEDCAGHLGGHDVWYPVNNIWSTDCSSYPIILSDCSSYPIILYIEWTTFIRPSLQPCPGENCAGHLGGHDVCYPVNNIWSTDCSSYPIILHIEWTTFIRPSMQP